MLSNEQQALLRRYLLMPWTLVPGSDEDSPYTLRVAEIPAVLGVGNSEKEVEQSFWEAMRSVLSSYIEDGEVLPKPRGVPETRLVRMEYELREVRDASNDAFRTAATTV